MREQLTLFALVCLLAAPCAARGSEDLNAGGSRESPAAPSALPQGEQVDALVGPDDLLFIQVFEVPEMSREYRVSSTGLLDLPLLPEAIPVTGLTPTQLAEVIGDRFREAGVLAHPEVNVAIRESRLLAVAVTGAVKRPQVFPIFGRTTLLDVLSRAEGLREDAGAKAMITRGPIALRALGRGDGMATTDSGAHSSETLTINLKRLVDSGDSSLNVDVYPGDRVTVARAGIIYVVGAVNRSGGYPLKDDDEDMTVLKALALAEDVKPTAKKSKAMIIRRDPSLAGGREEIQVNLKAILAGTAPDRRLRANDILFVPDSTRKMALRKGAEAAVQATVGVIIFHR